MSGEGGDEAFAGYETYRNTFWFEHIKAVLGPLQKPVGLGMSSLGRMLQSRILTKYGPRMGVPFEEYYLSRTSSPFEFFHKERLNLYSEAMARHVDSEQSTIVTRQYLSRAADYSLLNKMLYVDTNTWLRDELLGALRAQLPVEAVLLALHGSLVAESAPDVEGEVLDGVRRKQKVRRWTMKYLAKKALKSRIPEEILARRKAGFPIPYQVWLRSSLRDWVGDILLDRRTLNRGYFKKSAIEKLIELNANGADYCRELFSLVVLELWHRTFIDQDSVSSLADVGRPVVPADLGVSQLSGVA